MSLWTRLMDEMIHENKSAESGEKQETELPGWARLSLSATFFYPRLSDLSLANTYTKRFANKKKILGECVYVLQTSGPGKECELLVLSTCEWDGPLHEAYHIPAGSMKTYPLYILAGETLKLPCGYKMEGCPIFISCPDKWGEGEMLGLADPGGGVVEVTYSGGGGARPASMSLFLHSETSTRGGWGGGR